MKKEYQLTLDTPVQYLQGIGPRRSQRLNRIGVEKIRDLLYLIPRRYVDYTKLSKIGDLKIGDEVTISGTIMAVQSRRTRTGSHVTVIAVSDGTGVMTIRWFNRPDLKRKFRSHDRIILSGPVSYYLGKQLVNPNYGLMASENESDSLYAGTIIPVYPLTEGLNLWELRRAIDSAYKKCQEGLKDCLPGYLITRHRLRDLKETIRDLHFPDKVESAQ